MIHEVQELARTVRWSFNIYSIYSCQRSPFSVNVLSTGIRRCRARGAQACSWNLQATLIARMMWRPQAVYRQSSTAVKVVL